MPSINGVPKLLREIGRYWLSANQGSLGVQKWFNYRKRHGKMNAIFAWISFTESIRAEGNIISYNLTQCPLFGVHSSIYDVLGIELLPLIIHHVVQPHTTCKVL